MADSTVEEKVQVGETGQENIEGLPVEEAKSPDEGKKDLAGPEDVGNKVKSSKPPYKKNLPGYKKKHIVDELYFEFGKRSKMNIVTTPPGKLSSNKDFIKRNIERSSLFLTGKPGSSKEEPQIKNFVEESAKTRKVDIKERFYDKAETYKKKKEELKEKFEKDELSACTFQPKTNSKEKPKPKQSVINAKLQEYMDKQKKKLELAQENAKKAEDAEEIQELSYKPKICERSKEILSKRPQVDTPIHERLYNQARGQAVKQVLEEDPDPESSKLENPDPLTFHPTINKKSQNLARADKIENILYEDAIRRQNNPPKQATSPNPRFLNSNSEKVLIDKFKREFFDSLTELVGEEQETLNYTQTLELFKFMYFIRDDKEEIDKQSVLSLWRVLKENEEESISVNTLLAVLLAVMGFFEDWMNSEAVENGFSREDVRKLHKRYEQLYKNRSFITLKSNVNQTFRNLVELSFQPEMIAQSDELAERWRNSHREPGKIELALIAEQAKKEKRLNELKKQVDDEIMKECSFKPKTEELPAIYVKNSGSQVSDLKGKHKGNALYDMACKKEKMEKPKTTLQIKEEKELEECTFKPAIIERNGAFNTSGILKGADRDYSNNSQIKLNSKVESEQKSRIEGMQDELQTIKETLEDELSPKVTLEQSELENFEKIENMLMEQST